MKTTVEISARHIHLTREDFKKLFEKEELTVRNRLSQVYEFAAEESVEIVGPEGSIHDVRIIGPLREYTQAEMSMSNARQIGVDAPLNISGNQKGAADIKIIGPKMEIIRRAAIIPKRHWHVSTKIAKMANVKTGDFVAVKIESSRSLIFYDVVVRVSDEYENHVHLDTDEGNAAAVNKSEKAEVIIKGGK
jgi:putative phosphotransacetylase